MPTPPEDAAPPIRLGLLDFGELPVTDIVEGAVLADRLGYSRFWLGEHYEGISYKNSLLMTPLIAGTTTRMSVGPAGVLLRYYAPAAVAEDGLFLESVFGGRIDLGLAAGHLTAGVRDPYADKRSGVGEPGYFEEKATSMVNWMRARAPASKRPEVWLLGSGSRERAEGAAALAVSFSLSLLHTVEAPSASPLDVYRDAMRARGASGYSVNVAVNLACVESAKDIAGFSSAHPTVIGAPIVDTPARCRERIEELCHRYGVREVILLESSVGISRRSDSLRMLAEELRLAPES